MVDPDNFRTNVLTILGAVGYLVFFGLAVARAFGYPVSWELLGVIFSTASGLLSVEFGLASLPISVSWQPARNGPGGDDE